MGDPLDALTLFINVEAVFRGLYSMHDLRLKLNRQTHAAHLRDQAGKQVRLVETYRKGLVEGSFSAWHPETGAMAKPTVSIVSHGLDLTPQLQSLATQTAHILKQPDPLTRSQQSYLLEVWIGDIEMHIAHATIGSDWAEQSGRYDILEKFKAHKQQEDRSLEDGKHLLHQWIHHELTLDDLKSLIRSLQPIPGSLRSRAVDIGFHAGRVQGHLTEEMLGIPNQDWDLWRATGFDPYIAAAWHAFGFTPEQAKQWSVEGFPDPSEAHIYACRGFSLRVAQQQRSVGNLLEVLRNSEGKLDFSKSPIQYTAPRSSSTSTTEPISLWVEAGFPNDKVALIWKALNYEPHQAFQWYQAGFKASIAQQWLRAGFVAPDLAKQWEKTGWPPQDAYQLFQQDVTPEAALIIRERDIIDPDLAIETYYQEITLPVRLSPELLPISKPDLSLQDAEQKTPPSAEPPNSLPVPTPEVSTESESAFNLQYPQSQLLPSQLTKVLLDSQVLLQNQWHQFIHFIQPYLPTEIQNIQITRQWVMALALIGGMLIILAIFVSCS